MSEKDRCVKSECITYYVHLIEAAQNDARRAPNMVDSPPGRLRTIS